jgi:hypothetical protein
MRKYERLVKRLICTLHGVGRSVWSERLAERSGGVALLCIREGKCWSSSLKQATTTSFCILPNSSFVICIPLGATVDKASLNNLRRNKNMLLIGRFQVLTAASMKITVFWDVAPCSLVEVYRRCRGTCCLHHQGDYPDDEGSKYLCNVSKLLPDYMVQHPRIQPSSCYKFFT